MTRTAFSACKLLCASLVVALAALLPAASAYAQQSVAFVASTGIGTACTRAAPCGNITNAVAATNVGGAIKCLDSGPFDMLLSATISKSITVDCGDAGGVFITFNDGFVINGSGITVVLRNLMILGYGDMGENGSTAISFLNGSALHVENVRVSGFKDNIGVGIRFTPSTPGAKLTVSDSKITDNGVGSTGGGIVISPQSGGSAQVVLNRVTVAKNVFGIAVDGTGSTAGINMTITDSVTDGNSQDGIIATTPSGGAPIGVMVTNTKSANNAIGIRSLGPNVTVRVGDSAITGNGTGLAFASGGALLSYGTNKVQANGTNGAFSGPVALQ